MTIKICTHPDGCQNEPRKCLAEGCQEQKGQVGGLTPEENAALKYLKERYGTTDVPAHWIKTVAEYAADVKRVIQLLINPTELADAKQFIQDFCFSGNDIPDGEKWSISEVEYLMGTYLQQAVNLVAILQKRISNSERIISQAISIIGDLHQEYYVEGDDLDLRVKKFLNTVTRKE